MPKTTPIHRSRVAKKKPVTPNIKRLPAVHWPQWLNEGHVALRQAALLTMGVEPIPGAVKYVRKDADRRMKYNARYKALDAAYGHNPFLPVQRRNGKLNGVKIIDLKNLFEFSASQGWDLPKKLPATLIPVNRKNPLDPQNESEGKKEIVLEALPNAEVSNVFSSVDSGPEIDAEDDASGQIKIKIEDLGKGERYILETLGALAYLFEKIALAGGAIPSSYLAEKEINRAHLARELVSLIGERDGTDKVGKNWVAAKNHNERVMVGRLSEALKLHKNGINRLKSFSAASGSAATTDKNQQDT